MLTLYTTGEILEHLLTDDPGKWGTLIHKKGAIQVVVDELLDSPESLRLHRSGNISEEDDVLEYLSHPEKTLDDSNGVFIFDVDERTAEKIRKDYGVDFVAFCNADSNVLIEQGWQRDTSDTDLTQTWPSFFDGHKCPINSAIILDRFLFSTEEGDTIEDSLFNLQQIMEAILPKTLKDNVFNLLVVFDYSKVDPRYVHKEDGSEYSFKDLQQMINKLKKRITRTYNYMIEVVSVNRGCDELYSDTHDRHVITNYFISQATHKLRAYRSPDISLCSQMLYFNRLFSCGVTDTKSSLPIKTQTRLIKALFQVTGKPLRTDEDVDYRAELHYGRDGNEYSFDRIEIKNRLIS